MTTATDNTALENVLGDMKAGRAVPPEMVDAAVRASGIDEDAVNQRALVQTPVVEWEAPTTKHGHEPIKVAEHLVSGENAADAALKDARIEGEPPAGTGSNDPEVNPAATGGEPFANDSMVGTSGQVIDPGSYKEGETAPSDDTGAADGSDSSKSTSSTKTTTKSSK
jgi:hypothetical protein